MDLIHTVNFGYLGREQHHGENLVELFRSQGRTIALLPDSMSAGVCGLSDSDRPLRSAIERTRRVFWQLRGTRHPEYVRELLHRLDTHRVECLLGYWGTGVIGDLIAVKRHRPATRVILNLLCHPTALTRWRARAQDWYLRRSLRYLDGVIASSCAMRAYLEEEIFPGHRVPCLVWPPYLSQRYHAQTRLAPSSDVPNVLFLGRMDIARAQVTDNVLGMLQRLMGCGIHVHHCHVPGGCPPHPRRHVFTYTDVLADAIVYATQCDASLVIYNLEACRHQDRFELSVPDRLVASVAAGIPIAIPRRGYAACKEYLRDYPAVIEFDSPDELADRLRDRQALAACKQRAQHASRRYLGEAHMGLLMEFVDGVMPRRPGVPPRNRHACAAERT